MTAKKSEIWIANLDPKYGTETGKIRPVLIVQSNLLNKIHPSTLICPITTNISPESQILRVNIKKGTANVKEDCDVMIDQLRAIDNRRLIRRTGELPKDIAKKVTDNIKIILDIEN
ncbi:MAG TPA: type II toxin-antitoxin system PemK/MazF family toxin [Bacteroidales bacterium]|nr:type II toxin-antitoxin system PemK/MazF family toxin [Bacteroidales bacterium]